MLTLTDSDQILLHCDLPATTKGQNGRRFIAGQGDDEQRAHRSHLRTAIPNGDIEPGSRIRQEEIAERLGTSRLPVREALRMLETEGLTQLEANKSARVPALDVDELVVVYEMRERIETLALRMSIPHLTSEQVTDLYNIQD